MAAAGVDSESLAREILELQQRLHRDRGRVLTIATAESATAGRIADRLTDVPGASGYVLGGVIAYSNDAKARLLGVEPETLSQLGAVSDEVARQMAEGGRRLFDADICVSDSGIAGPGGATAAKPVGLFHIAISTPDGCRSLELVFYGSRAANKEQAASAALTLVRDYLLQCCDTQGD